MRLNKGAFKGCTLLTDVTIPNSVKIIGHFAFANSSLEKITIPDSVTEIYGAAFYNCSFKSVTIPENVTKLDVWAFAYNVFLEKVNYNAKDCSVGAYVLINGSQENCSSPFEHCPSLDTIIIGKNVEKIPEAIFTDTYIRSITIPENVTDVGDYAFYKCSNLEKVYWNAKNSGNITMANANRVHIGVVNVFGNCKNLSNVIFGENVEYIPKFLLGNSGGTIDIVIGKNCKRIGEYAFFRYPKCTVYGTVINKITFKEKKGWHYTFPDGTEGQIYEEELQGPKGAAQTMSEVDYLEIYRR